MNYHVEFNLDFNRNTYKGLYIVFEGIDGAGKTVQQERVSEHYRSRKIDVLPVTEPRRTGLIGRSINEFLQKRIKSPSASLQYLFSADRIAHQTGVILPALEKNQMVLSHRNFWSAVPYGIMDLSEKNKGMDVGNVILTAQSILSMYYQVVIPDITFYIRISTKTAMTRLKKMGTVREYYETSEKLKKVREGYEWMVEKFPKEFVIINGDRTYAEITDEITKHIDKALAKRK